MQLQSIKVPPVSRELIFEMRRAFPGPRISKGVQLDTQAAIWDAAQSEVVNWLERYAVSGKVSGDPADLLKAEEIKSPTPWWRRLFSVFGVN